MLQDWRPGQVSDLHCETDIELALHTSGIALLSVPSIRFSQGAEVPENRRRAACAISLC